MKDGTRILLVWSNKVVQPIQKGRLVIENFRKHSKSLTEDLT